MQQAILGIDYKMLVFNQRKLALKIFLVKLLPLFYIGLGNKIHSCFSIVSRYFCISLKACPRDFFFKANIRKLAVHHMEPEV